MKLGIDEAGAGAVLGPMVIGFCLVSGKHRKMMKRYGVDDSKNFTKQKRNHLVKRVTTYSDNYSLYVVTTSEIDNEGMNKLRNRKISEYLNEHGLPRVDKVIIDAYGNEDWIENTVSKMALVSPDEITAETKADKNHISVSAASIIAKVKRDEIMSDICEKYGFDRDYMNGYPSDDNTRKFLTEHYRHEKHFPWEARQKWSTLDDIREEVDQNYFLGGK